MKLWVAYYGDWSGIAVFTDELECYRYAVRHYMAVMEAEEGVNLREQAS